MQKSWREQGRQAKLKLDTLHKWLDSAMEFKLELSKSTIDKCLHTNACKIIDIAPNFEHKFVFLFSACEMSMMSSSLIDCDKGQYDELVNHPQDTWQYVVAVEIYS